MDEVEAVQHFKLHSTSMPYMCKKIENLLLWWKGFQMHTYNVYTTSVPHNVCLKSRVMEM